MTDFDAFGRNKGDVAQGIPGTPAVIVSHANADSVFAYKTCQAKFNMNSTFYDTIEDLDDSLDPNTCPQANEPSHNTTVDKGYAYWIRDGKCKQSFGHPVLTERKSGDQSIGFNLAFTSKQKCYADST